jgi:hypothetical protein
MGAEGHSVSHFLPLSLGQATPKAPFLSGHIPSLERSHPLAPTRISLVWPYSVLSQSDDDGRCRSFKHTQPSKEVARDVNPLQSAACKVSPSPSSRTSSSSSSSSTSYSYFANRSVILSRIRTRTHHSAPPVVLTPAPTAYPALRWIGFPDSRCADDQ